MSVETLVTVPISKATYERLKQRADEEKRSVSDLIGEALVFSEERREAFRRMGEAMERSQAAAILNGTSEMTMDEINEEIALARQEAAEEKLLRKSA